MYGLYINLKREFGLVLRLTVHSDKLGQSYTDAMVWIHGPRGRVCVITVMNIGPIITLGLLS